MVKTDYGYLTNSELRRLIKRALECGDREGAALYQEALDEHEAYDRWLATPPDPDFPDEPSGNFCHINVTPVRLCYGEKNNVP